MKILEKILQNQNTKDEIRRNVVLNLLKTERGKILDIGCQEGDMCYMLYQKGFEVCGVDIDHERIAKAKQQYPEILFKYGDCGDEIPFSNEFFDIVWAGDVIEHIGNTDIFVNEVNRVLKTGGLFVLSTPAHNRIKNVMIALFRFEVHFNPEFPHYRFYTPKSLKNVLEKRRFRIIKIEFVGRIWPFSNSMLVIAEKLSYKPVYSQYHY